MPEMTLLEKIFVNSKLQYIYHKWFGISRLLQFADGGQADQILELGCGIGMTTDFIASEFPDAKISALDYDAGQVRIARRNHPAHTVDFIQGDATHLEFDDESFDIIFQVFAFHHIPDYKKAMAEVHRTLKPNGRFLCLDIPVKSYNPLSEWITFQPAEFTKREYMDHLEQLGFHINRLKGLGIFLVEAVKRQPGTP